MDGNPVHYFFGKRHVLSSPHIQCIINASGQNNNKQRKKTCQNQKIKIVNVKIVQTHTTVAATRNQTATKKHATNNKPPVWAVLFLLFFYIVHFF